MSIDKLISEYKKCFKYLIDHNNKFIERIDLDKINDISDIEPIILIIYRTFIKNEQCLETFLKKSNKKCLNSSLIFYLILKGSEIIYNDNSISINSHITFGYKNYKEIIEKLNSFIVNLMKFNFIFLAFDLIKMISFISIDNISLYKEKSLKNESFSSIEFKAAEIDKISSSNNNFEKIINIEKSVLLNNITTSISRFFKNILFNYKSCQHVISNVYGFNNFRIDLISDLINENISKLKFNYRCKDVQMSDFEKIDKKFDEIYEVNNEIIISGDESKLVKFYHKEILNLCIIMFINYNKDIKDIDCKFAFILRFIISFLKYSKNTVKKNKEKIKKYELELFINRFVYSYNQLTLQPNLNEDNNNSDHNNTFDEDFKIYLDLNFTLLQEMHNLFINKCKLNNKINDYSDILENIKLFKLTHEELDYKVTMKVFMLNNETIIKNNLLKKLLKRKYFKIMINLIKKNKEQIPWKKKYVYMDDVKKKEEILKNTSGSELAHTLSKNSIITLSSAISNNAYSPKMDKKNHSSEIKNDLNLSKSTIKNDQKFKINNRYMHVYTFFDIFIRIFCLNKSLMNIQSGESDNLFSLLKEEFTNCKLIHLKSDLIHKAEMYKEKFLKSKLQYQHNLNKCLIRLNDSDNIEKDSSKIENKKDNKVYLELSYFHDTSISEKSILFKLVNEKLKIIKIKTKKKRFRINIDSKYVNLNDLVLIIMNKLQFLNYEIINLNHFKYFSDYIDFYLLNSITYKSYLNSKAIMNCLDSDSKSSDSNYSDIKNFQSLNYFNNFDYDLYSVNISLFEIKCICKFIMKVVGNNSFQYFLVIHEINRENFYYKDNDYLRIIVNIHEKDNICLFTEIEEIKYYKIRRHFKDFLFKNILKIDDILKYCIKANKIENFEQLIEKFNNNYFQMTFYDSSLFKNSPGVYSSFYIGEVILSSDENNKTDDLNVEIKYFILKFKKSEYSFKNLVDAKSSKELESNSFSKENNSNLLKLSNSINDDTMLNSSDEFEKLDLIMETTIIKLSEIKEIFSVTTLEDVMNIFYFCKQTFIFIIINRLIVKFEDHFEFIKKKDTIDEINEDNDIIKPLKSNKIGKLKYFYRLKFIKQNIIKYRKTFFHKESKLINAVLIIDYYENSFTLGKIIYYVDNVSIFYFYMGIIDYESLEQIKSSCNDGKKMGFNYYYIEDSGRKKSTDKLIKETFSTLINKNGRINFCSNGNYFVSIQSIDVIFDAII